MCVTALLELAISGIYYGLPIPDTISSGFCRPLSLPFHGCQVGYNMWLVGLNVLFWVGVSSVAGVLVMDFDPEGETPERNTE
jgi:hypothetical protein